ncbi:hypothetical protein SDC9_90541 [bioreactor metagenome]|uniref:Right handed beta helix domain-containing protein n=1 Tax=bioreactor metagenome TaxID=1076179 RepID=A0A645A235_9ZZZZ
MKFRKVITVICGICVFAAFVTGCSGSGSATKNTDQAGQTVYGQVQSISGKSITLLLGEMAQNNMPQGGAPSAGSSGAPQGEAPSIPSNSGAPQGEPPTASSSGAPQGEAPSGDGSAPSLPEGGSMGSPFTAGTETITITAGDSVSIVTQNAGQETEAALGDIAEDDILTVTFDSSGVVSKIIIMQFGGAMGQDGGNSGGSQSTDNGTAATTMTSDDTVTGATYTSSGDDENALRIDSATVALDSVTIEKTGGASSSSENGDFYGTNAGLLAQNGAVVTITNSTVTTSAQNGNGIFSYGEGTTINVSDTKIRTSADNSGGIQTTGGAVMNATNLDVETQGNSSAAIRSDRGGGTVTVDGGKYVSNGSGSPTIYSTANITVKNATLTANNSEAVVVEGKNLVTLTDCDVTGNMSGTYNDSSEVIHNVMIYQSMSGDAEVGEASFSMSGGSLTAKAGDMFYVTNTNCVIELRSVTLTLANDVFLRVAGNDSSRGWGESGNNGGTVAFTAAAQAFSGKIIVDDISSLDLNITEGSVFTGTINTDGQAGDVSVKLDSTSKWVLTGDAYITSFDGDVANITSNGYTVYVNGTAIN